MPYFFETLDDDNDGGGGDDDDDDDDDNNDAHQSRPTRESTLIQRPIGSNSDSRGDDSHLPPFLGEEHMFRDMYYDAHGTR